MRQLFLLLKNYRAFVFGAILAGMVSGSVNAWLIAIVSNNVSSIGNGEPGSVGLYTLLVLAALATGILSQMMLIHLSLKLAFELHLKISHQVMQLPLRRLEETGHAKLIASFTHDIPSIARGLMQVPSLFTNAVITIGCIVYLGILSPKVLAFLLVFLVFSLASYLLPERIAIGFITQARAAQDGLMKHFNALSLGSKELKLNYARREAFFNGSLREAAGAVRKAGYRHTSLYALLENWAQMLYFVFIGLLLFFVPATGQVDLKTVVGFTLVALYIRGPVSVLVAVIPSFRAAGVAFAKIGKIGMSLEHRGTVQPFADHAEVLAQIGQLPRLRQIELKGVLHRYYREKEDSHFSLGPLDLTIAAGEIVFIIGGNGSGKTTLAKILTGLYLPEDGAITLNGEVVHEDTVERYRQYFSAIYSDFFIFDQIMGIDRDIDERALAYLKDLQLDHKVQVEEGRFSTTALSTGQRKRLALLCAYLEDRQVYLFDEWAADQDPEFKILFYRSLVPELKRKGKTVVIISHDDRFFDIADRLIKLNDGKQEICEPQPGNTDSARRSGVPTRKAKLNPLAPNP